MERQQQELTPQRIGEEGKLTVALTGKKIKEASVEDLKQPLRYVMVKVGLRSQNWPTDEEKQILLTHIVDNFPNHTIDEIRLAFDLAICGKLDLDDKDISCYENFSCLYFSKIMLAYRKWSAEAEMQIRRESERKKWIEMYTPKVLTDEEYEDLFNQTKENVLSGNIGYELVPEMLYEWLDRKEKIKLSTERKKEIFWKAVAVEFSKLNELLLGYPSSGVYRTAFNSFKAQKDANEFSQATKIQLQVIARKIAVHELMLSNEPGE